MVLWNDYIFLGQYVFDLMSMIAFTQSIDTSDSQPGRTESLPMVNGNMVVQQYILIQSGVEFLEIPKYTKEDLDEIDVLYRCCLPSYNHKSDLLIKNDVIALKLSQ